MLLYCFNFFLNLPYKTMNGCVEDSVDVIFIR